MRNLRAAVIVLTAGLALHAPVVAAPVEETGPVEKTETPEKLRPKINHVLIISED